MIKRFCLPILFVLAIFMVRCKLDAPDMTGFVSTIDGNQPLTKGSTWTYVQSYSNGHTFNDTITMNGSRAVINGRTYYAATEKADTATSTTYFYQGNNEYRIRSSVMGNGYLVEYLYLKDDVAIGQTWTAPVTDNGKLSGFPAQIIGSVLQRDTTMTIGSITFNHVTHTQLQLQYDLGIGLGFTTYQLIDFYVARGIGIIETDTNAGQPINLKSKGPITSFKIEK